MSDSRKPALRAQVSVRRREAAIDLLAIIEDYLGGMEYISKIRRMTAEEYADFQWLMGLALSLKPYAGR